MSTKAKSTKPAVNRREFMKTATAAAAGVVGFPTIVPASALGLKGATPPSERVVLGVIGTGNQGTSDMRQFLFLKKEAQVVAVCDVDAKRMAQGKAMVDDTYDNKDCDTHDDFRELIERKDLDAVLIAVPDHWHAIPAIAASNKGLDIYCEKPLALTIDQGKAMVEAVRRNKTVWQTGSWQRSVGNFRKACELVRNGRIGDVHTVKVGLPTGSSCEVVAEQPVPGNFDYDFWLGPAPAAPYNRKRCHWNFRWILDYSGGQLTDWGAHHCDIANWAMGTEYTGPVTVEGTGVFPTEGLWNAATDYHVTATYGKGASPVAPDGFTMLISNGYPMGARFEGSEGWLHVSRSSFSASPDSLTESEIGDDEIKFYESKNHMRNFTDCVRSREKTITPIEVAHRAISVAHLGNIAIKLGRKLEWDPENEHFVNDATAERLLSRGMRGAWHV